MSEDISENIKRQPLYQQGYEQGREDAIEEFLTKSEFMRGYKFDSGKLSGVSLGECLDEIAKWVNLQKEVENE